MVKYRIASDFLNLKYQKGPSHRRQEDPFVYKSQRFGGGS
jgi:hypothetical protein